MTDAMSNLVPTPRQSLRDLTPARVSLPTTGHSIATDEVLSFQLAHAKARDAVHTVLHLPTFAQRLITELPNLAEASIPVLQLRSNAPDRRAYLRRPNLGRTLHPDSVAQLGPASCNWPLSSPMGSLLWPLNETLSRCLSTLSQNFLPTPGPSLRSRWCTREELASAILLALGLGASCSLIFIGERPGLSSADSMGAYLTWSPHPDRTDAERNCLSNIRDGGLPPEAAAARLFWYLQTARAKGQTGISLKEGFLELDPAGARPARDQISLDFKHTIVK